MTTKKERDEAIKATVLRQAKIMVDASVVEDDCPLCRYSLKVEKAARERGSVCNCSLCPFNDIANPFDESCSPYADGEEALPERFSRLFIAACLLAEVNGICCEEALLGPEGEE